MTSPIGRRSEKAVTKQPPAGGQSSMPKPRVATGKGTSSTKARATMAAAIASSFPDGEASENLVPRIRPVVIYPFIQPRNIESLRILYSELEKLSANPRYLKPTTVVNNQTRIRSTREDANPELKDAFSTAMKEIVDVFSYKTDTWSVDTCAMWQRGLGDAYEHSKSHRAIHDVFWLIPGDFNYATAAGRSAAARMKRIPESILDGKCQICVGEIQVPLNSAKQLIDTYGTYGLLYNWFPAEAQGIRSCTDKPRTEFFAISYEFLETILVESRWFAYEQTLMILLQNMKGRVPVRKVGKIELGLITDDESTRSTLSSAIQQVERTERALKLFWREQAEREVRPNWQTEFRDLDAQSESIRTAAMVILRRLLG